MAKLFPLLCLILVVSHSTYASGLWSVSYGEKTATPVQSLAESEGGQIGSANLASEQYYDNVELNQQQLNTNGELLNQPTVSINGAEHKVGTKGGFFGLFSRQKQSPAATTPILISIDPTTQQLSTAGYMEPVVVTNSTGNKEQKSRFRSYLPWNWVFVNPSTQPVEDAPLAQSQPPISVIQAPKRSWSFLPQRPSYSKRQFSQCYCWGPQPGVSALIPFSQESVPVQTQYPLHNPYGSFSNVQSVAPSNDIQGLESKPMTTYVRAPVANPKVTNAQTGSPVVAEPSVQSESALGSTGTVEQPNAQQVASQQGPYTFTNNANSASLPTSTNFQSSAGEPVQNTQIHSTN